VEQPCPRHHTGRPTPNLQQSIHAIQTRIDELLAEVDRLHRALASLGAGGSAPTTPARTRGTGTREKPLPSTRTSHTTPRDGAAAAALICRRADRSWSIIWFGDAR
jgi:hypothetical protein